MTRSSSGDDLVFWHFLILVSLPHGTHSHQVIIKSLLFSVPVAFMFPAAILCQALNSPISERKPAFSVLSFLGGHTLIILGRWSTQTARGKVPR
jgi:hypothetical protein